TLPVIAQSIPPRLVVAVIAVGRGHDRQICHGEQERRYAACVMLGAIGAAEMHPDPRWIVAAHDNETRASSRLPLAQARRASTTHLYANPRTPCPRPIPGSLRCLRS